jgi:F5/8 type C domain
MTSSTPTRPKLVRRAWEWLWRTTALQTARARQAERRHQLFCDQRARIATEVGERTLEPSAPWVAGSASHLASGLFVEAIGWALRAAQATQPEDPNHLRPASPAELSELAGSQRDLLLSAAADPDTLNRVLENLQERRFEARSLTAADAEQAARELGKVSRALVRATAQPDDLDDLYFQRVARVGLAVLLLVGVLGGFVALRERLERGNDLSLGKPWVASSSYETVCSSPSHRCDVAKSYFFHTLQESNPFIEIDLQQAQTFSKVRVLNRQDCCAERAVPLVFEVSTDHKHWREVARKTETFDDWQGHFPAVTARWVRFRVRRSSFLHLADVRVLK